MAIFSTSKLLALSAVLGASTFAIGASADDVVPASFAPAIAATDVDGEILVDMKDSTTAADIKAVESTFGIKLRANSPRSDALGKYEVTDVDPADESALVDRLGKDARVEHAEPMEIFEASFVPNDPLYDAKQWHLKRVGA